MQENGALYQRIYELCKIHSKTLPLKGPDDAQVYIDNLIRLRIVELGHEFLDEDRNNLSRFGMLRRQTSSSDPVSLSIPARNEFLKMTAFGQKFVAVCIVEEAK
jgi:hypothetical protein